ncbi:diaminopimelate decarboxylase [Fluviibacter phosphoraccumulans]|uniref:Diaminopimelate decarboxylase n=1 Tax=Fluviibacter phosphoraccumulans TaxID=1751046 RepID=A0A679IDM4_9RHOO|nr:diaminopimelate decarboxylase [Fluviibacter phosphoraccumulans]BBU68389.1 diaminopimelate decarboxylase [Fluviibacter phosphoraccumulans]BBU72456.1 diaminopimelate decarboxylase [Fluviibacter phosphoraccumulans]BCA66572.1 diaminopimelate decarboxylase [Fluviibacter phosphoraccumulans]
MSQRQFPHSCHLNDQNQTLHLEDCNLQTVAETFGTPAYVYSRAALTDAYQAFADTLAAHPAGQDGLVCFAVKANSNLGVLSLFAQLGSGFDIVSGGELARVLAAGGNPKKVVFSGVGKTEEEMIAALNAGILCFNVESASELDRLSTVAARIGKRAPISLRVNPDVDAKTHPYISTGLKENKFGVPITDALALYRHAASLPAIEVTGIDCHIGSQLLDPSPFVEALERILPLVDTLKAEGIHLHHIDLGGGLGIYYHEGQTEPVVADYLRPLLDRLTGRGLRVLLEPGRRLVGNAGVLLTKVEYLKHGEDKHFAIVDAAMNDLARPALYEAWHDIVPVKPHNGEARTYDIVGPVCETGDFLGQARPMALQQGDLLAVLSAGAYGMVMSSNYNTRPRAAEVLIDGDKTHLVRERETVASLYAGEKTIQF